MNDTSRVDMRRVPESIIHRLIAATSVSLIAVIFLTMLVLKCISGLITEMERNRIITISDGIKLAETFCSWYITSGLLSYSVPNFINIGASGIGEQEPYLGSKIISDQDGSVLIEYQPIKQFKKIRHFVDGRFEPMAYDAVKEALRALTSTEDLSNATQKLGSKPEKTVYDFYKLSTEGNCQWILKKIPASKGLESVGQTFKVALNLLLSGTNDSKKPIFYADTRADEYLAFILSEGGYVLSITDEENETISAVLRENTINPNSSHVVNAESFESFVDLGPSISAIKARYFDSTLHFVFPFDASQNLVLNFFKPLLLGWCVLVLIWGSVAVWWTIKPLQVLERTALDASRIIRADDQVPEKLESLAVGLRLGIPAIRAYKKLLSTVSVLLQDREKWMGTAFHNAKNNLTVIDLKLNSALQSVGERGASLGRSKNVLIDARSALDRTYRLLDNVTVYQRTVFGDCEPLSRIDLNSLLETIINDIEDIIDDIEGVGNNIVFSFQTQVSVQARKQALWSALENIIWNAYYHGGNTGIRINAMRDRGNVEIVIDDDGEGIEEDRIEEMFKPYRQGINSRGAGLGLTIAKNVIEDHGGKVFIDNRYTENGSIAGLRARVVLPLY